MGPAPLSYPGLKCWICPLYSDGTVFDNELWGANFGVLR